MKAVLVLLGLVLAMACGKKEERPESMEPAATGGSRQRPSSGDAGEAGRAGSAGSSEGGQGGAGGQASVGGQGSAGAPEGSAGESQTLGSAGSASVAPTVTITAPEPIEDPNEHQPLVEGELVVTCVAEPSHADGARNVDASSLAIQIVDSSGETFEASAVTPTGNSNEYSASFSIGDFYAPGAATIECAADDGAAPPNVGHDSIPVFIDLGPRITIESPVEHEPRPAGQVVRFEYTIEPDPLTDDDSGAEVSGATLSVRGRTFDLIQDPDSPTIYYREIDFSDPNEFSESPTGEMNVRVEASNSRDEPAVRAMGYTFILDGSKPVIAVENPADGSVVGGLVALSFTVTDDLSGVDKSTIEVDFGIGQAYQYQQSWGDGNPTYVFEFDSALISGSVMQITVNISAADNAGNMQRDLGASHILYLDNQPPIVSLDPPNVRDFKGAADPPVCSYSFDPVGPRAVNDGATIDRTPTFRAFVWEMTNQVDDPPYLYHATTNEDSVYLYLQPDVQTPLLVDLDGDAGGQCDALAIEGLDQRSYQNLVPVAPAGTAFFGMDPALFAEQNPDDPLPAVMVAEVGATPASCGYDDLLPGDFPDLLCGRRSDLIRVTGQPIGTGLRSALFAIGPLGDVDCTGTYWEMGGVVPQGYEGWLCLAARAEDMVGNVGFSPPLRVCLDQGADVPGEPPCSDPPPTCTDGCTIPSSMYFREEARIITID